jgi:hypothetical protein
LLDPEPFFIQTNWSMQLDFRGLEKLASSMFQDRREYIKADVATVVFDSKFIVPRVLSSQYQDCSRASRAFARIIGETDYLAVASPCSEKNERREEPRIESIVPQEYDTIEQTNSNVSPCSEIHCTMSNSTSHPCWSNSRLKKRNSQDLFYRHDLTV